ncbi:hypothetical protein AB0I28_19840 [Phytomonospora sp. NPDC050363]|uniref:HTTM domain-containing protein n=1 Tax=Phytomonospora sp. NPDC050363 TaxID=3155642 RepID=UPI003409E428
MTASVRQRHAEAMTGFDPRRARLALARTGLALVQLALVVANPGDLLMPSTPASPAGLDCYGIRAASMWCAGDSAHMPRESLRYIAMAVLLLVASGYRPRWTAIPHLYVTASIAASIPVINGGEHVAQIVVMLLVPVCLGDSRRWQWDRPVALLPGRWRGAAYAAHLVLRLQATVLYLTAGLSKLATPEWREGTALDIIARNPRNGFPEPVLQFLEQGTWWQAVATVVSWSTIWIEVAIGVLVWFGPRARRVVLVIGGLLHCSILFLMGLASFELTMLLLLVLISSEGVMYRQRGRRREVRGRATVVCR